MNLNLTFVLAPGTVMHSNCVESLIDTRTLKKRCALAACTEVKQTQEL